MIDGKSVFKQELTYCLWNLFVLVRSVWRANDPSGFPIDQRIEQNSLYKAEDLYKTHRFEERHQRTQFRAES